MAVTDRTRKILWAKAGGHCSVCRVQLVTEGTDTDDPSVFGQEAHIVSSKPKGPRARPIAEPDTYDNLILLCSKHHKQIDDQVASYPEDRVLEIKRVHEAWVSTWEQRTNLGPVRLVPDPTRPVAKNLKVFTTGSALWHFIDGSHAFYPNWPAGLSDEHEDLIAAFLDDVRDWNDAVGGTAESYQAKRDAARGLGEHIKGLAKAGFLVGGRERFCLLTGGVSDEPSSWRVIDIEVQPGALARLVDSDGNPLQS